MFATTMSLADGRTLGYGDWGNRDAPVVLYCHGFPGSHVELELGLPIIERSDLWVRVVALDRPGYGASTIRPGRSLLDWAEDVAEAVDRLEIEEFAMLGASGGAPYALAGGYALGERVTRIGIVAGTAPPEAPGMRDTPLMTGTSSLRIVQRLRFGLAAFQIARGREEQVLKRAISTMGPADRDAMREPQIWDWYLRVTREAFAQGGRASAEESDLYRRGWGFDIGAVRQPTSLWYGGTDTWVPVAAGRWLADRLPNSHFTMWPRHGHFTWAAAFEVAEVMAWTAGTG